MQYNLIPSFMRPLTRWPTWMDEDDGLSTLPDSSGLTMYEDEKTVTVEAAVPGVDPADIEVTYERGTLWIRGHVQEERNDEQRKYYRKASRSFSYRLLASEGVDTSASPTVTAKNGIVTVTFAKTEKSEPKKLPVRSA